MLCGPYSGIEVEMVQAEVVHHIAGRMRVRVPAAKSAPELSQEIQRSVETIPGVLGVRPNAALGTFVIQYDPALFGDMIQLVTEHASKADLFVLRPPDRRDDDPPVSEVDHALDDFFGKVNRFVEAATGHAVNLKEVFPFGILIYSLLFVDKAIAASQWLSWVQFAVSSYLELHEGEPIARVGDSVEALREELQELREELRKHFDNQKQA